MSPHTQVTRLVAIVVWVVVLFLLGAAVAIVVAS